MEPEQGRVFENSNKIDNPLPRLDSKKKRKDSNYQYQEKRENIIAGPTDIKRKIKKYFNDVESINLTAQMEWTAKTSNTSE